MFASNFSWWSVRLGAMSKVAPAEDTHSSTTTSPAQSMTSCTSSEEHRPRRPSEELRIARKSRRSSQMLHELTVGSLTADQRTMMGAKPRRNSVSDHPEFVPTLPPTKAARMLAVLTKYPKHFFWEHMYAIPPLVLAFLPVLVGGGLGRQMVLSIDQVDSPQEGLFNNFEELVQKYNNAAIALFVVSRLFAPIALYAMPLTIVCTLWSWRKLLKPVILMFMLPGFLISIAVAAVNVVLLLRGNIFLEPKMFYINMGLLVLFMPAALFRSGYVTGNPLFGWLIVPILILALGWAAFLNRFFFGAADLGINFFAEGTDHWKFIFVSVSASNSGSP